MEDLQALVILRSLANGVDPESGQNLDPADLIQRPQTVHALVAAVRALERTERMDRKRSFAPDNAMAPWTAHKSALNTMPARKPPLSHEALGPLILSIRGRRVMIDADLARLYGVETKVLNQAVKRNSSRFPEDFAFQLTLGDTAGLRSQIVTSNLKTKEDQKDAANRSQFVTGSQKHRDPRFRPWVFTEHGALMAANIVRSERATQMSVFVIRAFVRMREQVATNAAILKRLAEIDRTLLQHDAALRDVYSKLLPLLQPLPDPPKRRIGFIGDEG